MIEKLRGHIKAGRVNHEDLRVLNKHFITADGDAVEYNFEGLEREQKKLGYKALSAFWDAVDKAVKLDMLDTSGYIRQPNDLLKELTNPSKPNYVLKREWARAIRQYFDELKQK